MNKHVPSISVCMVTYNASPFLRECLDSILSQTFSDYELLMAPQMILWILSVLIRTEESGSFVTGTTILPP